MAGLWWEKGTNVYFAKTQGTNMTFKCCPACGEPFKNEEKVMAFMPTSYVEIESDITFAVRQPTKCYAIVHWDCFTFPFGEWHEPQEN